MVKCTVCEKEVLEHPLIRNVFYCNNSRCTNLGLLTVFVLEEKPKEFKKNDQSLPKSGSK